MQAGNTVVQTSKKIYLTPVEKQSIVAELLKGGKHELCCAENSRELDRRLNEHPAIVKRIWNPYKGSCYNYHVFDFVAACGWNSPTLAKNKIQSTTNPSIPVFQ